MLSGSGKVGVEAALTLPISSQAAEGKVQSRGWLSTGGGVPYHKHCGQLHLLWFTVSWFLTLGNPVPTTHQQERTPPYTMPTVDLEGNQRTPTVA